MQTVYSLALKLINMSCGNGLSHQRQNLHGYPPTLHGPFAVMPCVGEGTADIWPFMKRTWGYRDVLSKRTFSLWIWCSLVTQEVRKSLLYSPTWPLKGCVLGVGSERKRSSHLSSRANVDFFFSSCIAGQVRDMVGQQLE